MEKTENTNLNDPKIYFPKVKTRVTTTVDSELVQFAKMNNWSFQDLLTFAIQFKLAEGDNISYEYPNCELMKKFRGMVKSLEETSQELNKLKERSAENGQ